MRNMSGITKEQAEQHLQEWLNLDLQLAARPDGQYTVQGRTYVLADRAEIRANIDYWQKWCIRLGRGGGPRVRGVIAE
jgi:hypothetical protein